MHISDTVAESFRTGNKPKVNPNNKYTSKRRKMFTTINEQTGGDSDAAIDYSMNLIRDNQGRIKQYVMAQNEVPADDLQELAAQAYQLRCREIDTVAKTAGVDENEALLLLENDESENDESNNSEADNFLGELSAPIGIVGSSVTAKKIISGDADNFVDPALVTGVLNTIGTKVNAADLMRAAKDKPAGILGFLGAGGTSAYNALRKYFKDPANKDERDKVLSGMITDISQLKGYGGAGTGTGAGVGIGLTGKQLIDEIARQKKKEELQKMLPFIIGGVLVIVLIIIFVYRSQHKK